MKPSRKESTQSTSSSSTLDDKDYRKKRDRNNEVKHYFISFFETFATRHRERLKQTHKKMI